MSAVEARVLLAREPIVGSPEVSNHTNNNANAIFGLHASSLL